MSHTYTVYWPKHILPTYYTQLSLSSDHHNEQVFDPHEWHDSVFLDVLPLRVHQWYNANPWPGMWVTCVHVCMHESKQNSDPYLQTLLYSVYSPQRNFLQSSDYDHSWKQLIINRGEGRSKGTRQFLVDGIILSEGYRKWTYIMLKSVAKYTCYLGGPLIYIEELQTRC